MQPVLASVPRSCDVRWSISDGADGEDGRTWRHDRSVSSRERRSSSDDRGGRSDKSRRADDDIVVSAGAVVVAVAIVMLVLPGTRQRHCMVHLCVVSMSGITDRPTTHTLSSKK